MIPKLGIPESTALRMSPKLHLVAPGAAKLNQSSPGEVWILMVLLGMSWRRPKKGFWGGKCWWGCRGGSWGWPFRGSSSSSGKAGIAGKRASHVALGRSWAAKALQLSPDVQESEVGLIAPCHCWMEIPPSRGGASGTPQELLPALALAVGNSFNSISTGVPEAWLVSANAPGLWRVVKSREQLLKSLLLVAWRVPGL